MEYKVNNSSIKILVALQVIGHPRDSKRVDMLKQAGFTVNAAAFERDYHKGRALTCPVEVLGKVENGKYFKRFFMMLKAIPKMRKQIKNSHVVYASGADMAMMAILAGISLNKQLVLEVGDIRKIQVSKSIGGFVSRLVDKWIASKSSFIVVTATGFIEWYYRQWLKLEPEFVLIENKLESGSIKNFSNKNMEVSDKITIGYFGVLRCEWSCEMLAKIALSYPNKVNIVIAGIKQVNFDLESTSKKLSNFKFLGTYKSPDGLAELYNQVDIVWSCYPPPNDIQTDWWKAQAICRSNRFYESCYFKTPLISINGSGDAEVIKKFGIGLIIDNFDIDYLSKSICEITPKQYFQWKTNMEHLPAYVYTYSNEVNELQLKIKQHISKNSLYE